MPINNALRVQQAQSPYARGKSLITGADYDTIAANGFNLAYFIDGSAPHFPWTDKGRQVLEENLGGRDIRSQTEVFWTNAMPYRANTITYFNDKNCFRFDTPVADMRIRGSKVSQSFSFFASVVIPSTLFDPVGKGTGHFSGFNFIEDSVTQAYTIGQTLEGSGVTAGMKITGGSSPNWTTNTSQTLATTTVWGYVDFSSYIFSTYDPILNRRGYSMRLFRAGATIGINLGRGGTSPASLNYVLAKNSVGLPTSLADNDAHIIGCDYFHNITTGHIYVDDPDTPVATKSDFAGAPYTDADQEWWPYSFFADNTVGFVGRAFQTLIFDETNTSVRTDNTKRTAIFGAMANMAGI